MSIDDLRSIDDSTPIETDLCLIGSGFVGWAIAEELKNSGLRILMLESGGRLLDAEAEALNQIEDVGTRLFNGRNRALGGTSLQWGGRCVPFDDIDYEERPWVARTAWPFGPETMTSYVDRASEHLDSGPWFQERARQPMPQGLQLRPDVNTALMHSLWWENPLAINFGEVLTTRRNPNLWVLVRATVTQVSTDPTGRQFDSIEVADADGRRLVVRARAAVLCAGGVENPRIMLYSNRLNPKGVGNEHDLVGRYLMDHPRDFELIARFDPSDSDWFCETFGPNMLPSPRGGRHEFNFGFALSPERQRAEQLLNTAAWPYSVTAEDDPFDALLRLKRGPRTRPVRDAFTALRQPGMLLRGARMWSKHQRVRRRLDRVGFLVASEQIADPDSRVQLGQTLDRFGLPISRVDWRVHEEEARSQGVLAETIASEFARLGMPKVRVADWVTEKRWKDANFVDGCHPTSTTRMALRPEDGVVDANCQVHGVEGLYVAGSSVFPTAGHANPTLMIVAMAVRLADHLKQVVSTKDVRAAKRQPVLSAAAE